ncbi:MAG: SDR family oxidoreductase [Pseudomonadota bacterium]|nr:SDR family oxidoreductase [Pseudomonadota bacterium]
MDTVIVTGAGSGFGLALTRRLLEENFRVEAWDRDEGSLSDIDDDSLSFRQLDVCDGRAMADAVAAIETSAAITGLVTCAAIYRVAPFLEITEDDWDAHLSINLKGTLLTCQAVLPRMLDQRRGSVVMFSSLIARRGAVNSGAYAATKGGVLGLMRALALDHARAGIRANAISPGIADTPMPRAVMDEDMLISKGEDVPLGRIAMPEDIVDATMFLLGQESSFVTGQDIRVNGGAGLF